jgi:hypothetical protein
MRMNTNVVTNPTKKKSSRSLPVKHGPLGPPTLQVTASGAACC